MFRRSSKSSTKDSSRHDKKKEKDKEKDSDTRKKLSDTLKHHRTKTAPDPPTLLRLPSTTSTVSASSRSRRATNPSTPTAPQSASTAITSPSYFSPQAAASLNDARSPGTRRPPASFSGHGIDTSRGPPITLITRGNSDIARRSSQKPADYAFAQQQFLQSGLVSPSSRSQSSSERGGRSEEQPKQKHHKESAPPPTPQQQTNTTTPATSRRNSTSTARPAPRKEQPHHHAPPQPPARHQPPHMASSVDDDSSEYESDSPSQSEEPPRATRPLPRQAKAKDSSESEQNEDLFLNIAADSAPKDRQADATSRHDRLRSRIGRINRQSSPLPLQSSSQGNSNSVTPTSSRVTAATDTRTVIQNRRVSHQPTSSRTATERGPLTPQTPIERPPSRVPELNSKPSFSRNDAQLSPQDFLAQFNYRRRPSQSDVQYTPPARTGTGTYRPSNLGHYSTPRDDPRTPQAEVPQNETSSRADGTESHGSTGPAASVWDELDELKTRIRRIEMGGKIPATSSQVISQATAERPRTANTSATTVSSSPNQQRKKSTISPPESTVTTSTPSRTHPLLREALAKAKQHATPSVYRFLEATAAEALTLAEMTGSAGPQGTLHSASSILGGASSADRQVRRKADNICRSLTELCIAMCDVKPSLASPAMRNSATISRRPSVQIGPESPSIRQSIEPESNTLSNISPSRALSRIEARRTSMLNGGQRESSLDPYDGDRQISSRLSRAGTSLHRNRQSVDEDEEEPTLRAPSRAMTDFRAIRSNTEKSRLGGRQYTSREPLPDFQQAPALQTSASLRRPTVSGTRNENSLLFRDRGQYDFHRESSPAIEKQAAATVRARAQLAASRNPNNRNSIGGITDLGRSVSLGRRARGNSTGE